MNRLTAVVAVVAMAGCGIAVAVGVALAAGGCMVGVGGGGQRSRGTPAKPEPEGVYFRGGVGFGAGNRRGTVDALVEYRLVGGLHSLGMAVEGGLFLYTPPGFRWKSNEKFEARHGQTLGGGFTLRGRLAVGGWSVEPDALTLEAALGIGFELAVTKAAPVSLAIYASIFRVSLDERDPMWAYGASIGSNLSFEGILDMFE